jgi:hypothetical protein
MRLSHKVIMLSAAVLMGVAPALGATQVSNAATATKSTTVKKGATTKAVASKKAASKATTTKKVVSKKSTPKKVAAKKTTSKKAASKKTAAVKQGKIKLTHNAYVYHKNGKRDTNYAGGGKNAVIVKGVTLKYYGNVTSINGKKYYRIAKNDYIKVANTTKKAATKKPAKKASSKKLIAVLGHNAYVYNSKGKTNKKVIKKGKKVTVNKAKNIKIGKKSVPVYQINGKNQYIKVANIASINGKAVKAAKKTVTDKTDATKPATDKSTTTTTGTTTPATTGSTTTPTTNAITNK